MRAPQAGQIPRRPSDGARLGRDRSWRRACSWRAPLVDRREGLFLFLFLILLFAGSAIVRPHAQGAAHRGAHLHARVGVRRRTRHRPHGRSQTRDEDVTAIASWHDAVPRCSPARRAARCLGALPGSVRGYRAILEYELRSSHRGRFAIGPFRVTHGDPFGLVTTERRIADPQSSHGHPAGQPSSPTPGLRSSSGDGVQHELNHLATQRADELIAREYRPGDPLRRVHWRQTARRGELMVRQEEQEGDPEAVLLLDTSIPAKNQAAGPSRTTISNGWSN